jgi:hypothetical protein
MTKVKCPLGWLIGNGVDGVNRAYWQKLAEERVQDAKLLLDGGQWAAAYYLPDTRSNAA